MSYSYTTTSTSTFTITHARHIAAKVAADLLRIQRFYNQPSTAMIADYETEVVELLRKGYLNEVTYGFRRDGQFIEPTLRYKASDLYGEGPDDDPGKVRPNADVSGASFYSFLTYSSAWHLLSSNEQAAFKLSLPFQRTTADEPGVSGYLHHDKTYSAAGRALSRSSVRSY
jgi:hypothetical protein